MERELIHMKQTIRVMEGKIKTKRCQFCLHFFFFRFSFLLFSAGRAAGDLRLALFYHSQSFICLYSLFLFCSLGSTHPSVVFPTLIADSLMQGYSTQYLL